MVDNSQARYDMRKQPNGLWTVYSTGGDVCGAPFETALNAPMIWSI